MRPAGHMFGTFHHVSRNGQGRGGPGLGITVRGWAHQAAGALHDGRLPLDGLALRGAGHVTAGTGQQSAHVGDVGGVQGGITRACLLRYTLRLSRCGADRRLLRLRVRSVICEN